MVTWCLSYSLLSPPLRGQRQRREGSLNKKHCSATYFLTPHSRFAPSPLREGDKGMVQQIEIYRQAKTAPFPRFLFQN